MFGLPALAAALLIALGVRAALSRYPLWYDELASVFFASQPLSRLWSGWMVRETNPPLYYSLLRFWIGAFGQGIATLRGLSILGSLAAIAVTYAGMRDRFGTRAGAVTALCMALSAHHLAFAEEVRAYAFLYAAVTVSFFGLLRVADGGADARAGWIAYVAGALAAIYLHTTAVLWPAAASLALFAVDQRFRPIVGDRWWKLAAADLAIIVGAGWWLAITAAQMRVPNGNIGWIDRPGWDQIPALLVSSILLVRRVSDGPELLLVAVGALSIWGAAATWNRRDIRLAAACLGFAAALFVLASLKQPIMLTRTLFWLSIFPLVTLSAGVATLTGWPFRATVSALFAALAINLVQVTPTLPTEHWAEAARALARDPRAVVIVDGESMTVAMRMTCATALDAEPCPFPILTLVRPNDDIDHWARGAVREAAPTLPVDPDIYLFRRGLHDVLSDLVVLGALPDCSGLPSPQGSGGPAALDTCRSSSALVGPLPASMLAELDRHGRWEGTLFHPDRPVPIR